MRKVRGALDNGLKGLKKLTVSVRMGYDGAVKLCLCLDQNRTKSKVREVTPALRKWLLGWWSVP